MFNDSKYTKWYYDIVSNAKSQGRKKNKETYYERHHIIPKSLGGNDTKENLVLLTAREHFICHVLLVKMTFEKNKMRMAYALYRLSSPKSKNHKERYFSKIYAKNRENLREYISGKNSYMYGISKSNEIRQKIAQTRKIKGYNEPDKNPMFGKHHSIESKRKMSINSKITIAKMPYEKMILANPFCRKITDGFEIYFSIRDYSRKKNLHRNVIRRLIREGTLYYC